MAMVTNHARKRFKQRLGVHKTDTKKNARRALKEGLSQGDVRGGLSRYMSGVYFRHRANNIRLFNGFTYVFQGETLVTVFKVPDKFREAAAEAQAQKEARA